MEYFLKQGKLKNFFDFLFVLKNEIKDKKKFFILYKEPPNNFLFYLKNGGEKLFGCKVFLEDIDLSSTNFSFSFYDQDKIVFVDNFCILNFFINDENIFNKFENYIQKINNFEYNKIYFFYISIDLYKKNKNKIDEISKNNLFNFETVVKKENIINLSFLFEEKFNKNIHMIFDNFEKLYIDDFFNLIRYLNFFKFSDWKDFSLDFYNFFLKFKNESFFDLSLYFFQRDYINFFKLWKFFKNQYPSEYWTAYWGNQLWNAYYFVSAKNSAEYDKNIKVILPFWFISNGYQKYMIKDFLSPLSILYEQDFFYKKNSLFTDSNIFAVERMLYAWFFNQSKESSHHLY
jgi:hypothetical protein